MEERINDVVETEAVEVTNDKNNELLENNNSNYVEIGEIERPDEETKEEVNTEEENNNDGNEESSSDGNKEEEKIDTIPLKELQNFLHMIRNTIHEMESKWRMVSSELKLTQSIIKKIYDYNMEHAVPLPEEATAEAHVKYDHFNGLDNITYDELKEILGSGHNLLKGNLKDNIELIKNAMGLFINWITSIREYKNAYKEYEDIIDAEQEKNIAILQHILETEPNNPDRENIQKALNSYYDKLYLNFLSEPLSEEVIDRYINVFNSKEKFSYWEARAADKLKQIGVATLTIVELAQFETKYLEEKYHKLANMLALHVMNLARYARNDDSSENNMKRKILIITSTLHKFIEGNMEDEQKEKVLANVRAFLDQFLDKDVSQHNELFIKK